LKEQLSTDELKALVRSVFSLKPEDKRLAILVDVPDGTCPDNGDWRERRAIALDWAEALGRSKSDLNLESVQLIVYPNVHSNNADLPETAYTVEPFDPDLDADGLVAQGTSRPFEELLGQHQIILAPTEFSTTAPLKLLSKKWGFRAATMPGFSQGMIPALRLDYEEINRRVWIVKNVLDPAIGLDIQWTVNRDKTYTAHFDLRYRSAHASSGRIPEPGSAGNLPSGECYIVPYEGEKGEPSGSEGTMPVQFEDEVVLYRIAENKAVEVLSQGPFSDIERDKITREPAYSNIAEIGFGILKDFGIKPTGEILLDEKLGLHIAFGRSDHFGGAVGVMDFTAPDQVVHIDRIYIPEIQDRVHVDKVTVSMEDGPSRVVMENGEYTLF